RRVLARVRRPAAQPAQADLHGRLQRPHPGRVAPDRRGAELRRAAAAPRCRGRPGRAAARRQTARRRAPQLPGEGRGVVVDERTDPDLEHIEHLERIEHIEECSRQYDECGHPAHLVDKDRAYLAWRESLNRDSPYRNPHIDCEEMCDEELASLTAISDE